MPKEKGGKELSGQRAADFLLMQRITEGEEEALDEFYSAYFHKVYRYAYYRVSRDHQHAEEIVHDTFMDAISSSDRYDPQRGSIEAWLIQLSRNHIRSVNNSMPVTSSLEKGMFVLGDDFERIVDASTGGVTDDAEIHRKELQQMITMTMGSIPQDYAEILEWKYVDNSPVKEIALRLQKSEKAVESQLTRARLAFRAAFKLVCGGDLPEFGL